MVTGLAHVLGEYAFQSRLHSEKQIEFYKVMQRNEPTALANVYGNMLCCDYNYFKLISGSSVALPSCSFLLKQIAVRSSQESSTLNNL